ncbi:hypothetical protein HRR83_008333 [Exophiala dermatitidis]|uniref:protein disulfide-isomerase n=2 Tax=Exophiala dermatitidis TaxID=5970 RepID=H6C583_EXODN|nr:protein disulfide-isomerase [Exophiala dermatitidis NIH/UT8656]KAJ4505455.1 hypothetical protein HRR75_007324 [Exophiala dermatitidis]EHY59795.1 protein disulfide-isomerase [Exophiala dermatitidis NIH/UT8656]KAJ4507055.1 hypothetical protein HRR73_007876 [Exophiala dermatitidis]KAJ4507651.1 hypothetical protein HRR74_007978 [Exophiala dermatitidis]KAJ4533047.1 hypothetical protein HRR76_008017 [Exophiala dermatitidis]
MALLMLLPLLFLAMTGLVQVDAFYTKNSPVLQVTAKTYDSLIAQSNHTSIVEFYAPWCGHCQNLKPAYEKAAKNLAGLAKVAAINCDDDANKPFCGQMGIQGFPTLKIVRPGKKPGRPVVEDYNGPRSTKGIVDAVKDKIPNHVKRLQGDGLDTWPNEPSSPSAKAIVFSDKGTTSPLVKSLAIDFLGSITFAQVRDKAVAEKYGVTKFPTIVLVPAPGETPIPYTGEINRDSLVSFFSQIAPPNPDPAPKGAKPTKKVKPQSSSSASAAFSKDSEAHKSADFDDYLASSGTVVLDDDTPTESPLPIVEQEKPAVVAEELPPIPTLTTQAELEAACMTPKSHHCLLVLLPASESGEGSHQSTTTALTSLAEIAQKYHKRKASLMPTYAVPAEMQETGRVREHLGLESGKLEIIALSMKRNWWIRYPGEGHDVHDLEGFIDAIKLGELSKSKLPPGFGPVPEDRAEASDDEPVATIAEPEPEPVETAEVEHDTSGREEPAEGAAEPEPAETAEVEHDEL